MNHELTLGAKMIFDLILIIMLIVTLAKSSSKGCTEDLNFAIGFLIIVRFSGIAYIPLSKIVSKFIDVKNISIFIAYLTSLIIVFFLFNTIIGKRIIEFGKKIPKTTGRVLTYMFALFKTLIVFSVIFIFIYSFPVINRIPDKYITPKSYRLAYGVLGKGTTDVFKDFHGYLLTLSNPIDYFERQQQKQVSASEQKYDALKTIKNIDKPDQSDKK